MAARLEPTTTCQVLLAAGKYLVSAGRPLLYADPGIENVNGAVDATLFSACLKRVLAQIEVTFSNSMIEAFWHSLKHQWLYLSSLDCLDRLRALVALNIEQHNTAMPHAALFSGQTPDEMYFGKAAELPAELAAARDAARAARLATDRGLSCEGCRGEQGIRAESKFHRNSRSAAAAHAAVWNVCARSCDFTVDLFGPSSWLRPGQARKAGRLCQPGHRTGG